MRVDNKGQCIYKCKLSKDKTYCIGCGRTLEEIKQKGGLLSKEKEK